MSLTFGINRMIAVGAILDEYGFYIYFLCFYLELRWDKHLND